MYEVMLPTLSNFLPIGSTLRSILREGQKSFCSILELKSSVSVRFESYLNVAIAGPQILGARGYQYSKGLNHNLGQLAPCVKFVNPFRDSTRV